MLYLHVGTHKTGTSALQTFLTRRPGAMDANGIHYLKSCLGQGIAQHPLSWAIRGVHGRGMEVWDEARAELKGSSQPVQVISSEGFWFTDPARVREQLEGLDDVRVVIYLRRQDKYLQSLYKQGVTSGRKQDFATWRSSMAFRGDYVSVVREWAAAFGKDSIVIRPYERDGGRVDVTADFFANVLGIDMSTELAKRKQKMHNPSPRRELLELFRALNFSNIEFHRDKFFWTMMGKDTAFIRSADLLTFEECVALMQEYAQGNSVLAQEFYRGEGPLFPEMTPFPEPEIWTADRPEYFTMNAAFLRSLSDLLLSGEAKRKAKAPKADEED